MPGRRFPPPWTVLVWVASRNVQCYRSLGGGAEKGSNTMSESDTALQDEEVFSDELPDAVLEVAGGKCCEGPASSVTIGFCSGPETCPMRPALGGEAPPD